MTNMKRSLLFAVAVAGFLALAGNTFAGDALLSPKAKALADSLSKVPGTTTDMLDRAVKPGSPKAIAQAHSLRKVPSTGPSIDLAHGPRPTLSPKDPRYDQALRRLQEVQVAPLK
jgi:hypothetical protein